MPAMGAARGGYLGMGGMMFSVQKRFSVPVCSCAVCGDRCHPHSWSHLSPPNTGWTNENWGGWWELGGQGRALRPATAHATCMPAALGKQRHPLCLSFPIDTPELILTGIPPRASGVLCSQACDGLPGTLPPPPPPVCSVLFGSGSS